MTAETKTDPVDVAMALVVFFIGYPLAVLYGGWITVKLWGWFVLPTFAGAPRITWAVAVGLELLLMHMRPVYYPNTKGEKLADASGRSLAYWFIAPTFTLVVATAIHAWFQ